MTNTFNDKLDEAFNMHMRMLKGGAVSSYEAKTKAKQAIRSLILEDVIGEHEVIHDLANPAYTVGRNVVRQEQRLIVQEDK